MFIVYLVMYLESEVSPIHFLCNVYLYIVILCQRLYKEKTVYIYMCVCIYVYLICIVIDWYKVCVRTIYKYIFAYQGTI